MLPPIAVRQQALALVDSFPVLQPSYKPKESVPVFHRQKLRTAHQKEVKHPSEEEDGGKQEEGKMTES